MVGLCIMRVGRGLVPGPLTIYLVEERRESYREVVQKILEIILQLVCHNIKLRTLTTLAIVAS